MTLFDLGKLVKINLQVVVVSDVSLHGVLDGVWALEELFAGLLLVGTAVGIHVLIKEFPHVVGEVEDLEELGVLESGLELLGNSTVVFWFSHDFADQSLLAVQVVVVELLIDILEHGDPLDDVHAIEEGVLGRSILTVGFSIGVSVLLIVVPVGVGTSTAQNSTSKDQVANDCEKDESSEQGQTCGRA